MEQNNQFTNDGQKSVTKHNPKIKMENALSQGFTKQSIAALQVLSVTSTH